MKKLITLLAVFCVIGIGAYAQIEQDIIATDSLGGVGGDGTTGGVNDCSPLSATGAGKFWGYDNTGSCADWLTPSGSGDITTVGACTTGDCAIEGGNDMFPFIQEGTADLFETTFQVTDPTADNTITFPDSTGNVLLDSGQILMPDGSASVPSYSFSSSSNAGVYINSFSNLAFSVAGGERCSISGGGTLTCTTLSLASDIFLRRSGAGILSLLNGTNAQEFRVYNTDDGAGNTEYLSLNWNDILDFAVIASKQTGTGTLRGLVFNGNKIFFQFQGATQWDMDGASLRPTPDNSETLGTDSSRPSTVFTYDLDIKSELLWQEGVDTMTISVPALTAARAVSFPDAGGEVSLLGQTIGDSEVDDAITVSNYLPLSGGQLTGALTFSADNTHDIGADGATRPRDIYAAGNIEAATEFRLGDLNDTRFEREAAAIIQFGADSATPVDYELKGSDGSGTDINGANFILSGGDGSATNSNGGKLILRGGTEQGTGAEGNVEVQSSLVPDVTDTLEVGSNGLIFNSLWGQFVGGVDGQDTYIRFPAGGLMEFNFNGELVLRPNADGLHIWGTGNDVLWNTDGGGDIGNSADSRPGNVHAVTDITVGGNSVITKAEKLTKCVVIENLAATDDDMLIGSFFNAVTVTDVWCNYDGTAPTTVAQMSLEDGSGNAMTHTTPVCAAPGTAATAQAITAGGALTARETLRFDVDNTPDPATDTYQICIAYTID